MFYLNLVQVIMSTGAIKVFSHYKESWEHRRQIGSGLKLLKYLL